MWDDWNAQSLSLRVLWILLECLKSIMSTIFTHSSTGAISSQSVSTIFGLGAGKRKVPTLISKLCTNRTSKNDQTSWLILTLRRKHLGLSIYFGSHVLTDCSSQISMHMDASIVRMLFSIIFDNIVSIRFRESKINKTINEGKKKKHDNTGIFPS